MSRRTLAGVVAAGLLVLLVSVAALWPVPYVTVRPGPTINVLGTTDGDPIVQVQGHRTYPTSGQLRLVTVSVTNPEHRVSLGEAFGDWLDGDKAVVPREVMYPQPSSNRQEQAQSAAEMVTSQDTATAAALRALGYRTPAYAEVSGITPDGPSDGELEARDRVLRLAGTRIRSADQVLHVMESVTPGDTVTGVVRRRDGEASRRVPVRVTTTQPPEPVKPARAYLGAYISTGFVFPFDVTVGLDESIGGPSAGLTFALSIYDTLTPGSLTGGAVVAGTGTIDERGVVGPIGGIRQKIVGASDAGATLFLVPKDNCADAVQAPDHALATTRLVRADNIPSALRSLKAFRANPDADLPECA